MNFANWLHTFLFNVEPLVNFALSRQTKVYTKIYHMVVDCVEPTCIQTYNLSTLVVRYLIQPHTIGSTHLVFLI